MSGRQWDSSYQQHVTNNTVMSMYTDNQASPADMIFPTSYESLRVQQWHKTAQHNYSAVCKQHRLSETHAYRRSLLTGFSSVVTGEVKSANCSEHVLAINNRTLYFMPVHKIQPAHYFFGCRMDRCIAMSSFEARPRDSPNELAPEAVGMSR